MDSRSWEGSQFFTTEVVGNVATVVLNLNHKFHNKLYDDLANKLDQTNVEIVDLMLMAWLPKTDRSYWDKVHAQVIDLGRMYTGRIGWVIPDYIPKEIVDNIGDLSQPNIAGKFSNKIQGVGAGSALMGLSEQVLKIYNLNDLQLKYASRLSCFRILVSNRKRK